MRGSRRGSLGGRTPLALVASAGLAIAALLTAPGTAATPRTAEPSAATPHSAEPSATATPAAQAGKGKRGLRATVRWTKYGVPHIRARNVASLAAGYGYVYAKDNICTIANEYVTVNAERSRYFGPEQSWYFSGNGSTYRNLDADFYFGWVNERGGLGEMIAAKPPLGPKPGVKRGIAGYVKGYNRYLREVGVDNLPDPSCRGADWVRPITKRDVYRRFYQLGILASSGAVIDGIVGAEPISLAAAAEARAERRRTLRSGEGLERLQPQLGSNAYGFGSRATANRSGLLLGNPHFPWDGAERLYQAQLQIPGKLNVSGAALGGVPLILIGATRGLAWSHTVATAWRFTPFKLTLPPGDPHSYIVDGEVKPMEATRVEVMAKAPGGGLEKRTKTIHSTEYGPMIDDLVGIPLPWTEGVGFALKDVNADNFRYLNHFLATNKAQSVREYDRIQRRFQGIPWVNSIAADSAGEAYYSMQGAIPYVPDELAARCNVLAPLYELLGLPVLDGSRSSCDWRTAGDGVAPGTFPPEEVPTLFRRDYVHNGNDSHWLSNPRAPLEGFDRIIGIERAERTYRTRIGLVQVEDRLAGRDGLPGSRFNRRRLQRIALGNRQYLGELWRDPLVRLCELAPAGILVGGSGPVEVGEACAALRRWNLRDDLDSAGAILFRRFASNLLANFPALPSGLQGGILLGSQTLFTVPYSNADPVHTPRGLNIANPLVGKALADAVSDLEGAGIPLDAALRGHQYDERGGRAIPIHGGPGGLGVFNAINAPWDPERGYPDVPQGSSFIVAAQFSDRRCPVSLATFVTYGQTENQGSRHASDYTRAFSRKRWNEVPFCNRELRRETLAKQRLRIGGRAGGRR